MPLISAIICTYNGQKYIERTLKSLMNQSLSTQDYEIIVVDNNSKDTTKELVHQFMSQQSASNIHYVLEAQKGLSFARNKGIEASKSSIVVYVDDDAEANYTFLEAHVKAYKDSSVKAAGGKVIPEYSGGEPPIWFSKYLSGVFSLVDFGDTEQFFSQKYPAGCNMSFEKNALQAIGGFNNNIKYRSDEKFVFLNLKKQHANIKYVPQSVAIHIIDETRQSKALVIKVSQLTGAGERERLWKNPLGLLMKLIEYKIKFFASIILSIPFVVKGQIQKAEYLIMSRYYVLKGFLLFKN